MVKKSPEKKKPLTCGIVMPISAIDGRDENHWKDVLTIISDAIESVSFVASLVSDSDDIGVIQKRIVQNLYESDMIVCDVSGKNANVMFELGIRLAFDKPAIVIKDDETSYSFDTSPIEHIEYPRDLRFGTIVDFKDKLAKKIEATYNASVKDPNYTTFLKHFGTFTVAQIESKEVTPDEYIIDELKEIRNSIGLIRNESTHRRMTESRAEFGLEYYLEMGKLIRRYAKSQRLKLAELNNEEHGQDIFRFLVENSNPKEVFPRAEGLRNAIKTLIEDFN